MLNQLQCASNAGNTGIGDCFLDIKNIVGGFLVPRSLELTEVDTASAAALAERLQELAFEVSGRVFPLPTFEGFTNNSTEVAIQTLTYGTGVITGEGIYDWTFQYVQGGLCLHKNLRKFNSRTMSILLYDAAGTLYGVKEGANLVGIPLDLLYMAPFTVNDYANITAYTIRIQIQPSTLNDAVGFVSGGTVSTWRGVEGLQDIALVRNGGVLPAVGVDAFTGCDRTNIGTVFATELAVASAWSAVNGATGLVIPITSVTVSAGGTFTITVDDESANYPTSGGNFVLSLVSPTALAVLNVEGYESNKLVISVA